MVGVAEWPLILTGWLHGRDGGRGQPASKQTLSGTGACVYTAYRGWLGVVTGISVASTGVVLVIDYNYYDCGQKWLNTSIVT